MNALPNFDELLRRQREVFADRYTDNPALAEYRALMEGDAFDGVDQADLPDWHPDSFNNPGE